MSRREAGIGGAQVWALSVIAQQPGIGVSELARVLDIHQSTASNLVKTLLERSLVETSRDGPDRRAVALRIGRAGRAVLDKAPTPFSRRAAERPRTARRRHPGAPGDRSGRPDRPAGGRRRCRAHPPGRSVSPKEKPLSMAAWLNEAR
ncbi:MarR family winged helix-turn-helix transcriptional regulator [Massilia sp. B-10]|nr:MarR family winged helix-turn-helix transcriptional regulator [Massilia sp. B-10]